MAICFQVEIALRMKESDKETGEHESTVPHAKYEIVIERN